MKYVYALASLSQPLHFRILPGCPRWHARVRREVARARFDLGEVRELWVPVHPFVELWSGPHVLEHRLAARAGGIGASSLDAHNILCAKCKHSDDS